jgi:drug/metabolite transporter (DMT)-like permease
MSYLLGVILMLVVIFLYSLSNVIESYQSNNLFSNTSIFVFISKVFGLILLPIFLFFPPTFPGWNIMIFVLLASIFEVGYQMPYYLALRSIDTAAVVALFSIKRIFMPVLAYFILGEILTNSQYFGILLIVISSFLISFDMGKFKINKSFYWMAIASAMLSLQSIIYKFNFEEGLGVLNLLFWSILIEFVLATVLLLITRGYIELFEKVNLLREEKWLFIFNELLNQVANVLSLQALKILPVSIVEAMYSLISFTVILIKSYLRRQKGRMLNNDVQVVGGVKLAIAITILSVGVSLVLIPFV